MTAQTRGKNNKGKIKTRGGGGNGVVTQS